MAEYLTDKELIHLAKDTIDSLSAKGRAELLEWVKMEFPELNNTGGCNNGDHFFIPGR